MNVASALRAYRAVRPPTLRCPCCGEECYELVTFSYCRNCWYGVCGGDLASDDDLARSPVVFLS